MNDRQLFNSIVRLTRGVAGENVSRAVHAVRELLAAHPPGPMVQAAPKQPDRMSRTGMTRSESGKDEKAKE